MNLLKFPKMIRSRIKKAPIVLCHSITNQCNLRCKFCPFWRKHKFGPELSFEEIKNLIDQAIALGAIIYNVWGVEPLIREDLAKCLRYAKERGMSNFLITNGILLEERINEIAPYLDYLAISIDGIETYNQLRIGGELCKVLRGLELAGKYKFKTAINCVITNKNIAELEKLIEIAENYSAGILFEPVHEYEELSSEIWQELGIRNLMEYRRAMDRLIELKKHHRILNSITYLKMIRDLKPNFKCCIDHFLLQVDSNGIVKMCKGIVGSIREKPLKEIWYSEEASRLRKEAENCKGCLFSSYVEASLFYNGKPSVIFNYLNLLRQ
ncbi:MAG: radical SAM protein [Methanocellales archaeon]